MVNCTEPSSSVYLCHVAQGGQGKQGDQIGQFFQLGCIWRLIMIFWKDKVAQNIGNFLGYFLFQQIYYTFT